MGNEFNEQLKDYISQWREERSKEEDELKRLKEKQAKRKEIRAEQEKKLAQEKRAEEEAIKKEAAEKKAAEEELKKKAMEEAEIKRREMMAAQKEGGKKSSAPALDARKEMSKSKEQVEEEMKISLSIRIKPLQLDAMDSDELRNKANQIWNTIVALETDKYDYEQRQMDQDYSSRSWPRGRSCSLGTRPSRRVLTLSPSPRSTTPPSTCSPSTSGGQTPGHTATVRSCTRVEPRLSAPSGWSRCGRRSSQSSQSGPPRSCQSGSESDPAKRLEIRRRT